MEYYIIIKITQKLYSNMKKCLCYINIKWTKQDTSCLYIMDKINLWKKLSRKKYQEIHQDINSLFWILRDFMCYSL